MKFISHIGLLVVGFGLGIWWGVNHPTEAARMSQDEKQWIEKGKQMVKQEAQKNAPAVPLPAPAGSNSGH